MSTTIKVVGTIQVDMDVQGTLAPEVVKPMFKRGIADAVGIPIVYVEKLVASEIQQGSGLRRLQPIQTKRYEVSYEIRVPSSMDADLVVEKANRIAEPDTAEAQLFRQVLTATPGVAQVRQIVLKIPARKIEDETTSVDPHTQANQDKDNKSWKGLVIGGIAIFMAVLCCITSAVLIRRKMAAASSKESS